MSLNLKAVYAYATGLVCLAVTTLPAQDDVPSPTIVRSQSSAGSSPYVASTIPLGNVPEGVTIYYWPDKTAATATKVSFTPASTNASEIEPRVLEPQRWEPSSLAPTLRPAPLGPVSIGPSWQPSSTYPASTYPTTTLRPVPATTVQYGSSSGGQCVCTPASVAPSLGPQTAYPQAPGSYVVPQNGYVPRVGVAVGSPGAYPYRAAMPVSQLPADVYFGHGLIGQPKVYVQGQPVRNAVRYLSP